MSARGVHFALTEADVEAILSLDDEDKPGFVEEDLSARYTGPDSEFSCVCEKVWDPIHRVLTDGELDSDGGDYPYSHAILGGRMVYGGEGYLLSLKTPREVADIARALPRVTEETFRIRYLKIDESRYGRLSDSELASAWRHLQLLSAFYGRAAAAGCHVLFAADE